MKKIISYSQYYNLDDYLFRTVTQRFNMEKSLSDFDFFAIILWKSNRSISIVKTGLKRAKISPKALMKQISACTCDQDRMNQLYEIKGIGVPIASAVLAVCYPDRFTILDYRAWEALVARKLVKNGRMPTSVKSYFDLYLSPCQDLAGKLKIPLRELDRSLWGWSKSESIRAAAAN